MEGDARSSAVVHVLEPSCRWKIRPAAEVTPALLEAAGRLGISERLVRVLSARGTVSPDDVALFLGPAERGLHDPMLLPDAERVRERIDRAAARHERALVFGDFDADGLTGLAILTIALRVRGVDAAPYVPSRLHEGHGLSSASVERARVEGRTLIVTADCGTSSVSEVDDARRAGIDVLITDHHRLPASVPAATALVNLHRPDSSYPDSGLAGSGVAFKIAQLLLGQESDESMALADLAAIGTVADVAPLVGENRALVRLGLQALRSASRPGLAALMSAARLNPEAIDVDAIAFQIAPRLNAVGRLGDAIAAARLLLSQDAAECEALAAELESANVARRELLDSCLTEARFEATRIGNAPAVVLAGPWPVGIVGLIAGRLAEEIGVPAVVFSTTTSPWRGSARSANGCDVGAAFSECADLFERYGGHAAAAGCSLAADDFGRFIERFNALAGTPPTDRRPELIVDLAIAGPDVDYRLFRELQALAPTGAGNPAPLVGIEGLVVTRARALPSGHTQATLRKGFEVLDAIAFDRPDLAEQLAEGTRIDVVARLASRAFGGFESLQLELLDAAPTGHLAGLRVAPPASVAAAAATAVAAPGGYMSAFEPDTQPT
jgi:single-stranded-DNA-specific exonuclease